jgi:hypothetical protein
MLEMRRNIMNFADCISDAETMLKRTGKHLPTIVVSFEEVSTVVRHIFPVFPRTPDQRQQMLYQHGKQMGERWGTWNVHCVWFTCEGWLHPSRVHPLGVASSQAPRRREVLVVFELDVTGEKLAQRIHIREMLRDRKKHLKELRLLPDFTSEENTIQSALVLAFLAGFAEASTGSQTSGTLQKKIFEERLKLLGF